MKKKSSTKDLALSSNERLFINSKSIFRPKKYSNLKPKGLDIYTFHAGFKKKHNDLLIIIFDKPAKSINAYSKTSMPSAPIIWDKANYRGTAKVLIVNSGNANAHTGRKGIQIIDKYTSFISKFIGCKKNQIIVSSTGVIGESFDPDLIIKKFSNINKKQNKNILEAAKAIMTTDTYAKVSVKNVKINNYKFKIYGIAKGSGMIFPNMGTMLAYVFIEVDLPKKILQKLMKDNLDKTFNSISTDGDTSTSDTLVLFSLNKKKILINKKTYEVLSKSLLNIMEDLSLKIVQDGEGLTKLIKINIFKSRTKNQAKNIAFAVVNSPLVKTAISGEDANWGRIIAAIGKTNEKINQNKIKILFGKNLVCQDGAVYSKINLNNLDQYMKSKKIEISIYLNNGNVNHTVYGNDLTNEYIRINSDYRS